MIYFTPEKVKSYLGNEDFFLKDIKENNLQRRLQFELELLLTDFYKGGEEEDQPKFVELIEKHFDWDTSFGVKVKERVEADPFVFRVEAKSKEEMEEYLSWEKEIAPEDYEEEWENFVCVERSYEIYDLEKNIQVEKLRFKTAVETK